MRLVALASATTATSSWNIAWVMPLPRAEAVCEWMQYSQLLVIDTAMYSISFTSGSSAPGAITAFTCDQMRASAAGSWASTFQKLLTDGRLRVAMMSSYTARTSGDASSYSMGGTRLMSVAPGRSADTPPRGTASVGVASSCGPGRFQARVFETVHGALRGMDRR